MYLATVVFFRLSTNVIPSYFRDVWIGAMRSLSFCYAPQDVMTSSSSPLTLTFFPCPLVFFDDVEFKVAAKLCGEMNNPRLHSRLLSPLQMRRSRYRSRLYWSEGTDDLMPKGHEWKILDSPSFFEPKSRTYSAPVLTFETPSILY